MRATATCTSSSAAVSITWLLLNLVLLACSAVPAMLALRADRAPQASSRIAHEQPQGLSPAQFRRSLAFAGADAAPA